MVGEIIQLGGLCWLPATTSNIYYETKASQINGNVRNFPPGYEVRRLAVYVKHESQVGEESGTKYIGVDRSMTCCDIAVSGLLFTNYGLFGHWTIRTSIRTLDVHWFSNVSNYLSEAIEEERVNQSTLDDSDLGWFLCACSIRTLPLESDQEWFRYGCAARHFKTQSSFMRLWKWGPQHPVSLKLFWKVSLKLLIKSNKYQQNPGICTIYP